MTLHLFEAASDVWLKRPKLAAHIATVSQIWARTECELALIFVILSGSNLAMGVVFSDVIAIRNRLNMIEKLATAFLDAPDVKTFERLSKRVRSISKRRNDVIHGLWSIRDDEPENIFLTQIFPDNLAKAKPILYNHKRFVSLENDLETLRFDLAKFRMYLIELAQTKSFPRPFLLR